MIPIILIVWIASKLEKQLNKVVPGMIKSFTVPLITLAVMTPASFIVVGPIAAALASAISNAMATVFNMAPAIGGALIGGFWQILVMFGMHWGLAPMKYNNLSVLGYDFILAPKEIVCFSQVGCLIAIYLKTKDKKVKSLCPGAVVSGICGITEPAIYGITLPLKRPFVISCITSAVFCTIMSATNTVAHTTAGLGVFAFPIYIDSEAGSLAGLYRAVVLSVLLLVASLVVTMVTWKEASPAGAAASTGGAAGASAKLPEAMASSAKGSTLTAPVSGEAITLEAIADGVFSEGVLGQGCGIKPDDDKITTPFSGYIIKGLALENIRYNR